MKIGNILEVDGKIVAKAAENPNEVVVKSQLDAIVVGVNPTVQEDTNIVKFDKNYVKYAIDNPFTPTIEIDPNTQLPYDVVLELDLTDSVLGNSVQVYHTGQLPFENNPVINYQNKEVYKSNAVNLLVFDYKSDQDITAVVINDIPLELPITEKIPKEITTEAYTLTEEDSDFILHFTHVNGCTLTIPEGLPLNKRYEGKQLTTGGIIFDTVVSEATEIKTVPTQDKNTSEINSVFAIDCLAEDIYLAFGNLTQLGGGSGATSYNELTDKATVDLPTINTPLNNALSSKVDKVAGKGLSTNDYTTAEKNKLSGIEAGAEVNVQSDWDATSGAAELLNKPTEFPPSSHTHPISQVTGLQTALDGKMDNADIGPVRIFNQDPLTTVTATGTSWNTFLGTNKVELTAAQVAAGKSYSLRILGRFQTTNTTSAIRKFRVVITAGGSTNYQEAVFETSVNAGAHVDISGIFDFGGTTASTLIGFYGSGMLLKADGISPITFLTSSGNPLDTTNGVTIDFQFQGAFPEDEFISAKVQVLDINNQVILTV